jgi:hypothetical protein
MRIANGSRGYVHTEKKNWWKKRGVGPKRSSNPISRYIYIAYKQMNVSRKKSEPPISNSLIHRDISLKKITISIIHFSFF